MAYNAPSIAPYNYNANPPPDDGSRTAANRVSWAKVRTALSDPLRSWMDAINNEIARAFAEVSEFYLPVGTVVQVAWAGSYPGFVGLNLILSTTDYARLASAIAGIWNYTGYGAGQMLTPPLNYYGRYSSTQSVGTLLADQNKSHSHGVVDPGHAHALQEAQFNSSGQQSTGGTRAADPHAPLPTAAAVTGITIAADGGSEARPLTMILQGMVKA